MVRAVEIVESFLSKFPDNCDHKNTPLLLTHLDFNRYDSKTRGSRIYSNRFRLKNLIQISPLRCFFVIESPFEVDS